MAPDSQREPYEPPKVEQREVISSPLIGFATIISNPTGGQ